MIDYITREGDSLDLICFRYYGESRDYTEAVRAANPDLTAYGPILPNGVVVQLPDFPELDIQQSTIRLWS